MDESANEMLAALTRDIIAAYAGHNRVGVEELPGLIVKVYGALNALGAPMSENPGMLVPAVPIRASVKPDHVTCLECGKPLSVLKRHLRVEHDLLADDYLARWGLPRNHPLIAPDYAKRRREIAKRTGLGHGRKRTSAAEPSVPQQGAKKRVKLALRF